MLAFAIAAAIVAYSVGWYHAAGRVADESDRVIAAAAREGARIECAGREVRGYPFRLGLHCDSIEIENARRGYSFRAGTFRSAAQIYQPAFLIGEMDGTALLEVPAMPPARLDWENLRASVRWARPVPERISIEIHAFRASARDGGVPLLDAERSEVHMRPNGEALDLAVRVAQLQLPAYPPHGNPPPPLDGDLDVTIDNGVARVLDLDGSLRGHSGTIRRFHLASGGRGAITARGTFRVGDDGLADAELTVTVTDPRGIGDLLAAIFPQKADEILGVASNLGFFGDAPEFPLTLKEGKVFVGPFEVGEVPPLP